jgi:hypothetical protein
MSDDLVNERVERAVRALTPTQRADNERFMAFWDTWPQTAADLDPDEWVAGRARAVRG